MATQSTLPALQVQQQQQPDLLQKYGQLMALRNSQQQQQMMQQEAPVRQQILNQQAQSGQIQLQEHQQQLAQQQAFGKYMSDPSVKEKTLGGAADALAKQGIISPQIYTTWKKADLDQRNTLATITDTDLKNQKAAHDATQQLYDNIMDMPDDQLAANWPSVAQQYDAIPGNNKQPLDPNNPLTKQQLQQFAPLLSMNNAYLDHELERRKAKTAQDTAEVDLQTKQQGLQFGPTGPAADSKYRFLQAQLAAKQPITADNQAWMKGYEKQKLLVPATTANIRVEGAAQGRQDAATQRYVTSAQNDLQKQFSAASTQLDKVHDAQNLLANGGNAGDVLASMKTLSSLAAGQGSGVRITQAELNGVLHNQGIKGNIESWLSQAQGEGTMSPQRRDEISRVLNAAEAELQKKMSQQDQYMDRLTGAKSPDEVNAIKSEYRKSLYQPSSNNGESVGTAIGATKKFPNGKTGVWDGHGWVAQ